MRKRDAALLNQVEEAGLSATASVPDAPRACIALGGRAGSTELREWAQRELNGYLGDADLPEYRRIAAPLRIDAVQGNQIVGGAIIKGQRISPGELPDVVADKISEELELRQSIDEIEKLAHHNNQDEIRLSPPMGADIVRLMNSEMAQPLTAINELYWAVSTSALMGVVDRVRTMLVALVAEIRASLPEDAELPSGALAAPLAVIFLVGNTLEGLFLELALAHASQFSSASAAPKIKGNPKPVHAWSLAELITAAYELGVLGEDVSKHAHQVRSFRNYIHPRQQLKEGFEPRLETARIAYQVLRATLADLESLSLGERGMR